MKTNGLVQCYFPCTTLLNLTIMYGPFVKPHIFCMKPPLRKHVYSNILKILPSTNEKFQIKNSDIFHISVQNKDCRYSLEPPRRGGSNEYHNLCFWAEIRKKCIPLYTPILLYKSGVYGGQNYIGVFSWRYFLWRLISVDQAFLWKLILAKISVYLDMPSWKGTICMPVSVRTVDKVLGFFCVRY